MTLYLRSYDDRSVLYVQLINIINVMGLVLIRRQTHCPVQ